MVIGVTGSAGKTATKDLTAAALAATRRVHASPASFNNEAGVPLTLLGAPLDTEVVIVEMGARFAGNIAALTDIARPQLGIVTHIGLAHAGHLGGPEPASPQVKGELIAALPADGVAILNADCPYAASLAARSAARVRSVGTSPDADVRVRRRRPRRRAAPPVPRRDAVGRHDGRLAAARRAPGHERGDGASRRRSSSASSPRPGRGRGHRRHLGRAADGGRVHTGRGVALINDAYNSSPTSAAAALRALGHLTVSGRRVAVLGEMLELGDYSPDAHAELGSLAASVGVDLVVAVGEAARPLAASATAAGVTVLEAPDCGGALTPRRGRGATAATRCSSRPAGRSASTGSRPRSRGDAT